MSLGLQCLNHRFFLLWRHPSEHAVLCNCILKHLIGCQCRRIYISVGIFKSGTLCNRSDRHRIITGNDLKIYLLAFKECQCIWCFLSDHICHKHQCKRFQSLWKFCPFYHLGTMCQNQYSKPVFSICLTSFCQLLVIFWKQELCCSHQICAFFFKNGTTVFSVGRKWNHMFQCHTLLCRKTFTQCIDRCILIFEYVHHIAHDLADFVHKCRTCVCFICRNLSCRNFCYFCIGYFGCLYFCLSGFRIHFCQFC